MLISPYYCFFNFIIDETHRQCYIYLYNTYICRQENLTVKYICIPRSPFVSCYGHKRLQQCRFHLSRSTLLKRQYLQHLCQDVDTSSRWNCKPVLGPVDSTYEQKQPPCRSQGHLGLANAWMRVGKPLWLFPHRASAPQ